MDTRDPAVARALLAVARMVHDEVERAGLLTSDVPERALAVVERWSDGQADAARLGAAVEELLMTAPDGPPAARSLFACALHAGMFITGGHPPPAMCREGCMNWAAESLAALGEPEDAAIARVAAVYDAALRKARERAARPDGGG